MLLSLFLTGRDLCRQNSSSFVTVLSQSRQCATQIYRTPREKKGGKSWRYLHLKKPRRTYMLQRTRRPYMHTQHVQNIAQLVRTNLASYVQGAEEDPFLLVLLSHTHTTYITASQCRSLLYGCSHRSSSAYILHIFFWPMVINSELLQNTCKRPRNGNRGKRVFSVPGIASQVKNTETFLYILYTTSTGRADTSGCRSLGLSFITNDPKT